MAKINFTKTQSRAVFYPDGNLLLSAAAGSGKTAALTSRIVHLISSGKAQISEMLIVTFTNAAAAEMKARISKMLRENIAELKGKDPAVVSRLSEAISQLPSADISTMHAFLYKSIKPYFPALNLAQDSSIIETSEMDAIKAEIMRDTVDDFFDKRSDDSFVKLADTIGQARDTTAIDHELLWLAEKLNNAGQPISVLLDFADTLCEAAENNKDIFATPYGERILGKIQSFCAHYKKVFDSFADDFAVEPLVLEKYGPSLDIIASWLAKLCEILNENPTYSAVSEHFRAYDQGKLGSIRKDKASETSELYKKFRKDLKNDILNMTADFFSSSPENFTRAAKKTADILRSTHTVIEEYKKRLEKKKRTFSVLEFSDLDTCAIKLFCGENGEITPAAREIAAKYKYVFIDEYQDTNRVQDNIFRAISSNSIRFMVGDIKQSIYRFRGADPRVFSEYRMAWDKAPLEGDCIDPAGASILMSENFRCSDDIIRFINAVSDKILPFGGIPYEKDDALIYGRAEVSAPVPAEIALIDRKVEKGDSEAEDNEADSCDTTADINPEAVYVAKRIKEMIGRYSDDGSAIISASDIAILLRSPSTHSESYRRALENEGIPAKSKKTKPLGEYPSVMLLLCLLRFIDNPLRDIYTAGIMKSSIFGFSVEDLITLRREAGALPLYTAVLDRCAALSAADGDDPELTQKCLKINAFLEEEKTRTGGISAAKYLENLLQSMDFLRIKEIRGKSAETDAVRKILTLAKNFDSAKSGSNRSIHAFIDHLTDFLAEDTEAPSSTESDAVSIMSIHASKGLEFPVVFLCECSKKRSDQDERRTVLFDDVLGFGMQLPDETGLVKCDNIIRRAIAAKMAEDSTEEEMRMLYVALTRARSKLIVTAKVDHADLWLEEKKSEACFSDDYAVKNASSYIEWICMAAAQNESRSWVITQVDASEIRGSQNRPESANNSAVALDEALFAELTHRAEFEYPYDFLKNIPAKLIVSRLDPEILDEESASEHASVPSASSESGAVFSEIFDPVPEEEKERPPKRPSFMSGSDDVRANEIGTATHKFLQFADFSKMREGGYESELLRLKEEKYLTEKDCELVNKKQLEKFLSSSLFDDLTKSTMVKREFRFNVRVDAADFTANDELKKKLRENGIKLTVQGVVDCVYRSPKNGKLVLIDYKTDSVRGDEWQNIKKAEERLTSRHRNQLEYYRKICSDLFEEEIPHGYIYSTVLGRCLEI